MGLIVKSPDDPEVIDSIDRARRGRFVDAYVASFIAIERRSATWPEGTLDLITDSARTLANEAYDSLRRVEGKGQGD